MGLLYNGILCHSRFRENDTFEAFRNSAVINISGWNSGEVRR